MPTVLVWFPLRMAIYSLSNGILTPLQLLSPILQARQHKQLSMAITYDPLQSQIELLRLEGQHLGVTHGYSFFSLWSRMGH